MSECPNLKTCGFCKKYNGSKSLAVKGFINMYCLTEKQNQCKRRAYKECYQKAPPDEMMPNGGFVRD